MKIETEITPETITGIAEDLVLNEQSESRTLTQETVIFLHGILKTVAQKSQTVLCEAENISESVQNAISILNKS